MAKTRTTSSSTPKSAPPAVPSGITPKQKDILDFIGAFNSKNGYAPSQQEIAKQFKFKSLGTVHNCPVRLERQGFLRKSWNARRGMQVIQAPQPAPPGPEAVPLPLLGR